MTRNTLTESARRSLVRELARTPDGVWITCDGHSMTPTIARGDRVRVRACQSIRPGDVVLFEAQRRGHVLHRVVFPVPGTPWFVHVGDAGSGTGAGLARRAAVVGRADISARLPSLPTLGAGLRRAARAAWRAYQRKISLPNV